MVEASPSQDGALGSPREELRGGRLSSWRACAAGFAAFLCLVTVATWLHLHLQSWMTSLVGFFSSRSVGACVSYTLLYVAVSLACLPLTPLEVFTGFCFGVLFGICLDIVGRVSGAVLSFTLARVLARQGQHMPRCMALRGAAVLRGVGQAVEEQGLRFLILFNLAYVPVAVKNYGLGFVAEVPLHKFIISIFIIEVPMATIWATVGATIAEGAAESGLSTTNATVAGHALWHGTDRVNWQIKLGLLGAGVAAMLAVLHIIHSKVSVELAKIQGSSLGMESASLLKESA